MRLSTKTMASLLIVTAVAAAVPGISKLPPGRRRESQFDRLLQRHDRKAELRAEILGLDPMVLRKLLRKMPLSDITRHRGFKDDRAFRLALFGKLRSELHGRGWALRKIDRYVTARSGRMI